MFVNGQEMPLEAPCSVTDLVKSLGYDASRIAILLNGTVLPKEAFATTEVSAADKLEIVQFVGGG